MSQVFDTAGRAFDAVQLTAPATVDGQKAPAGWYVITDQFGQRSLCSPEAYVSLFQQSATGGSVAVPVPALPADQLAWQVLIQESGVLIQVDLGQTATYTLTGAQGLRQLIVDAYCLISGGAAGVSVLRRWTAGLPARVMDSQGGMGNDSNYSGDFGEGSRTGRLLGAPEIDIVLSAGAGNNSLWYLEVVGR